MTRYILLACLCLLSACTESMIVGSTAKGVVTRDYRSFSTVAADTKIYKSLTEEFTNDPDFEKSHIVLSSFNRNVLLAGQTTSQEVRQKAEDLTKKTPQVKKVYNEIKMLGSSTHLTRTSDTWITSKVKTALFTQHGLRSGRIKVVTENGDVYLMGVVSEEQAKLAVKRTRSVPGVQRVVKVFE